MNTKEFVGQLRHEEIVAAIGAAELKTSGEIRVFVSRNDVSDPVKAAEAEFVKLGMTSTSERNGVLIYVAPKANAFAVIGDEGIHRKCGPAFWEELAGAMREHFRAGNFTAGIVQAATRCGDLLAEHFPRTPNDRNELRDDVEHD